MVTLMSDLNSLLSKSCGCVSLLWVLLLEANEKPLHFIISRKKSKTKNYTQQYSWCVYTITNLIDDENKIT